MRGEDPTEALLAPSLLHACSLPLSPHALHDFTTTTTQTQTQGSQTASSPGRVVEGAEPTVSFGRGFFIAKRWYVQAASWCAGPQRVVASPCRTPVLALPLPLPLRRKRKPDWSPRHAFLLVPLAAHSSRMVCCPCPKSPCPTPPFCLRLAATMDFAGMGSAHGTGEENLALPLRPPHRRPIPLASTLTFIHTATRTNHR